MPVMCILGVTIDDKLTWKCHRENISRKISKSVAIIYKLKLFVNNKTLLDLYYSLIYTYMTYCNIVWGTAYNPFKSTHCFTEQSNESDHPKFFSIRFNWSIVYGFENHMICAFE